MPIELRNRTVSSKGAGGSHALPRNSVVQLSSDQAAVLALQKRKREMDDLEYAERVEALEMTKAQRMAVLVDLITNPQMDGLLTDDELGQFKVRVLSSCMPGPP